MKITYDKATYRQPNKIRRLAMEAKKARLYVAGWLMCSEYNRIICEGCGTERHRQNERLVVAYIDGVPVGACLMVTNIRGEDFTATFVRKKYRRLGIGTGMVKKNLTKKKKRFVYDVGTYATVGFFQSFSRHNIKVQRTGCY